jgi:hypothetical protein
MLNACVSVVVLEEGKCTIDQQIIESEGVSCFWGKHVLVCFNDHNLYDFYKVGNISPTFYPTSTFFLPTHLPPINLFPSLIISIVVLERR